MTKEIIGFINKNNDIFNLKDDSSVSKYCSKVGQGHENKIAIFTEDGDLKDSEYEVEDFVHKVEGATDGNLALFNTEGSIEDSGITSADICTMEFYNGDETLFRESSVIDSILTAGIHNVSYVCNNDTNHNFYSILFVSNNYGKMRGVTGYNVIQYLLDNKGYYTRYRQFRDAAHTDPIGDWTDWKNTDVVNSVEAGIYDPVSSDAVYTALQEKADKVVDAIAGNLASLDENGNLQDSGKKPSDFAEAGHGHKEIRQTNSDDELALISATANEDGDLWINLTLREADEQTKVAKITYNNINNLNRALEEPDTIPNSGSAKLVTSGGVYNELQDRPSRRELVATVHSMLVLVKTSYPNACQGRDSYDFQEYMETYTDANGRLWTIYLWSDGDSDYFMLDSPAEMQIGTTIYEYNTSAIAAIKANTATTITSALTSFEYDVVGNI